MGLDDIRALEDLETTFNGFSVKYNQMIEKEKEKTLRQTVEEFSEFFSKAKFTVQQSSDQVTAKYGGSSVMLGFSNPYGYAGFSIRMELIASLAAHKPQKLILGLSRHLSEARVSASSPKSQTVEEKSATVKAETENLKNKIDTFSGIQFHLFARSEDQADKFKAYDSLTALLTEITN